MRSSAEQSGSVYFLGTLPGSGASSLARDGVVMFAMLHRVLNEGALTLGKAQQRDAAAAALGADSGKWHAADQSAGAGLMVSASLPLRAGVMTAGDQIIALNRPVGRGCARGRLHHHVE